MSRHRRRNKINETVIPPDSRRADTPGFRGSTINEWKTWDIEIGDNFNVKHFVDTYSTEGTGELTAWSIGTRSYKAYVVQDKVISIHMTANFDMSRLCVDGGCMLVFKNCVLVNYTGTISLLVSGIGVSFQDCTFISVGNVNISLGNDTVAAFDKCSRNGNGMLRVYGNSGNTVSVNACRAVNRILMERVATIYFNNEFPENIDVDTAERVIIHGVTESQSIPPINLHRVRKEVQVESCNFTRMLSIDKSLCRVRLLNSTLDALKIHHSVIDGFSLNASMLRLLVGHSSVMMGAVIYDYNDPEITYVAATNCLDFPAVPLTMYKKVNMRVHSLNPFSKKRTTREVILRLSVPGNASKHYSASYQGKFRVSEAKVEEVLDLEGNPIALPKYRKYDLESLRDSDFVYVLGKTAYPEEPFDTGDEACASGIHGYPELKKAADYS